ncbi:hypothetical protein ACQ4PT_019782 [Festuca glaucescens]
MFFLTSGVRQTPEDRHYVCMQWALFFYECGIPFNVASSRQFQIAIEASCQYDSGYKPPSPYELREPLLKDCVKETKELRKQHEVAWKEFGCTLMSDGWSDRRGRHLINFLVNSPEGTYFLESVDASSECQDARMIADLLEKRIDDIGRNYVVQVVTDNGANYKAAGKILMDRIPTLYWSPCACHCLDLMLEDIGKLKAFKKPIARGRRVTTFIYRHGRILSLMRKATGGLDLVRPSNVNVHYQRQRKRSAPSTTFLDDYDLEDDQEQHSSIPNVEDDDSDFLQDDVDVTEDEEDPTSAEQDGEDTNAIMDEFDDGY